MLTEKPFTIFQFSNGEDQPKMKLIHFVIKCFINTSKYATH